MNFRTLQVAALLIVAGVILFWMTAGRMRRPDTSSVAPFAPYAAIGGDIAPSWSPDGKLVIYCRYSDNQAQLYTIPADGGPPQPLASGVPEGCLPAWSPDGTRIAFTSLHSERFQLLRVLGLARSINIWTVGSSGGNPHQVTNDRASLLDPSWSPDGSEIAFTALPGPRIMTAQASGGESKLVAQGLSPDWSPDGKWLAYLTSQSRGLEVPFSLFVQPAHGGTAKRLDSFRLKSNFQFRPSVDWSMDGERLLSVGNENGRWQPVVIDIARDTVERIFPVDGSVISPRWSRDGSRIVYAVTNTGRPPHIEVLTVSTLQTTKVTSSRSYTTAQLVRYRSGGKLEIPSWLYLPREAESAKHPALVWLHGGLPGTASMPDEFDATIQYFVDQGFVVLAPNYRGSAGFGDELAKFARGDDMMPDLSAAVDYLKGLHAVDSERIGVLGLSFGGYLALRAITQLPELFAAAVDFFGPSDLEKFYRDNPATRDTLRQLLGGAPEQNAEAYRAASPINFVGRIRTPLLILHGTSDDVVQYSQSVALAKALARSGKKHEFLTYRAGGHGFTGEDDIDAKQQAMRFLLAQLKAP